MLALYGSLWGGYLLWKHGFFNLLMMVLYYGIIVSAERLAQFIYEEKKLKKISGTCRCFVTDEPTKGKNPKKQNLIVLSAVLLVLSTFLFNCLLVHKLFT